MEEFNEVMKLVNAELLAQWKIQSLRSEIRCNPRKAAELERQIAAARITIICARRGYLYTA